jgi:hypothetical protein
VTPVNPVWGLMSAALAVAGGRRRTLACWAVSRSPSRRASPPRAGRGGRYHLDSGVCRVKGKRVNVITFRSRRQQRNWNDLAMIALPSDHWWATGKGALVTARDGNCPAAKIGAKRLPGVLKSAY